MGVTLYSNIDYKGDSITEPIFGVHEEMQPDWNDYVNSIKMHMNGVVGYINISNVIQPV